MTPKTSSISGVGMSSVKRDLREGRAWSNEWISGRSDDVGMEAVAGEIETG